MPKIKIKASSINNLTDARYFAAREVEWLGFRLSDSQDSSISLPMAKAIAEWVDGVKIVGEFDFPTAEEIEFANSQFRFDAVQVGMFTPVDELEKLSGLILMKEVVVENTATETEITKHLQEYAHCCPYFLLDFLKSGINWEMLRTGYPLPLGFLQKLFEKHKVILSLDFLPSEVQQVFETLKPECLSLVGGGEERIGLKSFDELDEILETLDVIG